MKFKNGKLWITAAILLFSIVAAVLVTRSFYQSREGTLKIANARIYERLFLEILRGEIRQAFPEAGHTVSALANVTSDIDAIEFTTTNDVYFTIPIPAEKLKPILMNLTTNLQVADWVSLAEQKNIARSCQFILIENSGDPFIRMLMHESSHTGGLGDEEMARMFGGAATRARN